MKKKHADYSKIKDILEKEFKKLDTKNDPEFGTVCLLNAKKVEKKVESSKRKWRRSNIRYGL